MARGEVVRRTTRNATSGTVEPYQDDDMPEWFGTGTYQNVTPDWHVVRPPSTGKFQDGWAKVVMPFRAIAVGFLWLTLYWWRTALALAAVLALVLMLTMI